MSTSVWSREQAALIGATPELRIATTRSDGTVRPMVPIWVVTVADTVYVRTWRRRSTGWYGHAVSSGRARVGVPGLERAVSVLDVGAGPQGDRSAVDAAYRHKYGAGAASMVTDEVAATTLRLDPLAD